MQSSFLELLESSAVHKVQRGGRCSKVHEGRGLNLALHNMHEHKRAIYLFIYLKTSIKDSAHKTLLFKSGEILHTYLDCGSDFLI